MDFLSAATDSAQTVAINSAASGDITIFTPESGNHWSLLYLFIQAEADTEFILKSGSTAISGPMNIMATQEMPFSNAPLMIATSTARGDAFVINNSGTNQLNGWAVLIEKG